MLGDIDICLDMVPEIWKLFSGLSMSFLVKAALREGQDPGYGVAHSPLQLLRLHERRVGLAIPGKTWETWDPGGCHWEEDKAGDLFYKELFQR